jgi:GntR family carbon starvation induced transcriptional regulator
MTDADTSLTRIEATYQRIRHDIIDGELAPGERLGVDRLRARYGVGASTIREALSLLSAEALVDAEGQRGFAVAPISIDDLRDLCEARKLIEAQAVRESVRNGDDDWEGDLVAAFHRLTRAQERLAGGNTEAIPEWELRNREFHDALVSRCESRWMHLLLDTLMHHTERYRRASLTSGTVKRDVHGEHAALMQAALERDAERAAQLVVEHIDHTVQVLEAQHSAAGPSAS